MLFGLWLVWFGAAPVVEVAMHGPHAVVVCLRRVSAVLLLHTGESLITAGDQGSYFGHVRAHGRVASGCRVAAGTSRTGFGTGGGNADRLDRLRMLEYYVTAYVFAHTLYGCLDGEPLVWHVQASREACPYFDEVGGLLVSTLSPFPQFRHECRSMESSLVLNRSLKLVMCSSNKAVRYRFDPLSCCPRHASMEYLDGVVRWYFP